MYFRLRLRVRQLPGYDSENVFMTTAVWRTTFGGWESNKMYDDG